MTGDDDVVVVHDGGGDGADDGDDDDDDDDDDDYDDGADDVDLPFVWQTAANSSVAALLLPSMDKGTRRGAADHHGDVMT